MTLQHSIEEFSENVRQDVLALAESEEQDVMLSDSFTQTMFDMLSEAGEFDDPLVCYHRARGMEISGYGVDEDEGRIDLFLSIHTNSSPPETVTRQRVEVAFRRLRSFLEWCLSGRHVELEESSPVFDMAAHIHAFRGSLTKVRLCVITDGRTTIESVPQHQTLGDITISSSLWDVVRLHRLSTSGRQREAISIDLRERFREPIPCLQAASTQEGYRAFLMLIPGDVLRSIYADFGSRLLETNVRSFLQARGKVNRGIRDTIAREPDRFLAYNNGITLTAETVELCDVGGSRVVARLNGLQIVNGGQTTASLLAADRGVPTSHRCTWPPNSLRLRRARFTTNWFGMSRDTPILKTEYRRPTFLRMTPSTFVSKSCREQPGHRRWAVPRGRRSGSTNELAVSTRTPGDRRPRRPSAGRSRPKIPQGSDSRRPILPSSRTHGINCLTW